MRAKLLFPKRKVVKRGKTGQEGKKQFIQGCCLAGNETEGHTQVFWLFSLYHAAKKYPEP